MKNLFTTTPCLSVDQIQNYLAKKLDSKNRQEVENHLLDCELCAAAVEGFAESYDFETDKELEQLASQFSTTEATREAPVKTLPNHYRWINRIAAAAVILILPLAGWMYWNAQAKERLFSQYFQSYESDYLSLRGEGAETPNPMLQKAMEIYQQKEYLESIPLFDSYLEQVPENTIAAFHAGMASLEAGQTSKAIQYFEIVRLNDPSYYEDASWYLALAYLDMDRVEEANGVLEDLATREDGFYFTKVKALQKSLKQ